MKSEKVNAKWDINPTITGERWEHRLNVHSMQHMDKLLRTNGSWFTAMVATVKTIILGSYEPNSFTMYIKLQQQIMLIHASSIVESTNVHHIAFKALWKVATGSWCKDYVRREENVLSPQCCEYMFQFGFTEFFDSYCAATVFSFLMARNLNMCH